MTVDSAREPLADIVATPARMPVWQVQSGTRLSRAAGVVGSIVVVALIAAPAVASRNLIQDLVFVFTMLALAQLWNALAGWGGLISVGQQAFVGVGAYALLGCVTLAGIDPIAAIPLAGCFAAAVAAVPLEAKETAGRSREWSW